MPDGPLHDELIDGDVTVDMRGCARCHGSHVGVTFRRLTHPVELAMPQDICEDLTHWAPCPTNGEPILMRIVAEP